MSVTIEVTVSDETAEELSAYDDERIEEAMLEGLEELASASEKRDELHERMNIDTSGDDEELSGEALEEEMRKWLRGKRDTDPRLD
jgi:hypothetical protein